MLCVYQRSSIADDSVKVLLFDVHNLVSFRFDRRLPRGPGLSDGTAQAPVVCVSVETVASPSCEGRDIGLT